MGLDSGDRTALKSHILVDARFAQRKRGGDRYRFELASALLEKGRSNYSILAYEHAASALGPEHEKKIIESRIRPSAHPESDIFEHVLLPAMARLRRFDLYHGTFNVLPLFPAAPRRVVTVHDVAVFDFPEGYGKKFGMYMRQLIRRAIASADTIIADSVATKVRIAAHFPDAEAKTEVILCGVGHEYVAAARLPVEQAQQLVRQELSGKVSDSPYILFVGNLEPKKNLPRLIEAFRRFKAQNSTPHELWIVGEELPKGPGSGLNEAQLRDVEDVRFLGFVPDELLPALYRGADLAAYPSLYEGFGMPVLEALAAGTAVLTSNISSLPEAAGGLGCLVDPTDVEAMAVYLQHCLSDAAWRRHTIEKGTAHGAAMTWERHARAVEEIYFKLLSTPG